MGDFFLPTLQITYNDYHYFINRIKNFSKKKKEGGYLRGCLYNVERTGASLVGLKGPK